MVFMASNVHAGEDFEYDQKPAGTLRVNRCEAGVGMESGTDL